MANFLAVSCKLEVSHPSTLTSSKHITRTDIYLLYSKKKACWCPHHRRWVCGAWGLEPPLDYAMGEWSLPEKLWERKLFSFYLIIMVHIETSAIGLYIWSVCLDNFSFVVFSKICYIVDGVPKYFWVGSVSTKIYWQATKCLRMTDNRWPQCKYWPTSNRLSNGLAKVGGGGVCEIPTSSTSVCVYTWYIILKWINVRQFFKLSILSPLWENQKLAPMVRIKG